ncbi:MAG: M15 family metallopeptidase [Lysobacteraceae bacterium]
MSRDLINSETLERLPAGLARARAGADARRLARGQWLIRRKRDGRFLAVQRGETLTMLRREPLPADDLAELCRNARDAPRARPLHGMAALLQRLGVDADYAARTGLAAIAEPTRLACAGRDRYARPLWLAAPAAQAWAHLRAAAQAQGIALEAISGYRSHAYQFGIFERKLARGLTLDAILRVNAAPGFSEHHGGCALDIGTPGEPPAEESFERTAAFAWLSRHGGEFGFRMSYPRDNPHGVVYEPWHWCWRSCGDRESGIGNWESVKAKSRLL